MPRKKLNQDLDQNWWQMFPKNQSNQDPLSSENTRSVYFHSSFELSCLRLIFSLNALYKAEPAFPLRDCKYCGSHASAKKQNFTAKNRIILESKNSKDAFFGCG